MQIHGAMSTADAADFVIAVVDAGCILGSVRGTYRAGVDKDLSVCEGRDI